MKFLKTHEIFLGVLKIASSVITIPYTSAQSVSPSHQYTLRKNVEVTPKLLQLHFNSFTKQVLFPLSLTFSSLIFHFLPHLSWSRCIKLYILVGP